MPDPKVMLDSLERREFTDFALALIAERDAARAEADAMRRERDAVIGLLVEKSAASVPPDLWDVLLPDAYSPLGFSWTQDLSRDEGVAAVRKAAGLDTPGDGDDHA